jgi:hypothetical protein
MLVTAVSEVVVRLHRRRGAPLNGLLGPGRAFLQKPFTPGVLASKIREILS